MKILKNNNATYLKGFVFVLAMCATAAILLPSAISLKTYSINGKIIYNQNTVADDAAVSLLNETDMSLVNSVLTDSEGKFKFAGLKPGKYYIAAASFGNKLQVFGPFEVSGKSRHLSTGELIIAQPGKTTGPVIKGTKDNAPVINRAIRIS